MGVETHAVRIVPIKLEKHPNADRLSIVRIHGFTVVVATENWLGVEKAAYVEPDSVLPDKPEYRFLKDTSSFRTERLGLVVRLSEEHESDLARLDYDEKIRALEAKIDANTKHLRITVRKLRGVISMGMLLPCPEGAEIGDDVAGQLGITRYQPPTIDEIEGNRRHARDDVAQAPPMIYAPKYDVENAYRWASECFEAGEPVYVSEKLDGQNGRFVASDNGNETIKTHPEPGVWEARTLVTLYAGSRTEWKKKEGGSNWWRALEQNPWVERWCYDNQDSVLYGEVFGFVQALRYGARPGQLFFRAFDVIDGTEYLDVEPFVSLVAEEHRVPSLGIMPFDFEKLQKLADGPSLVPGANHLREGIVVRPIKERKHWKLGRVILKMVSNDYLEKSNR